MNSTNLHHFCQIIFPHLQQMQKRGWDKSPSLFLSLDCRARRSGWVGSTTLISSTLQPYSTVRWWDDEIEF